MEKENIVLTIGYKNPNSFSGGFIVSVETVVRRGIFQFDIIGLANKTISESKQRILSAIAYAQNQKRHYLNKKITTLLSPADSKKEGSHFDLPIAISYLISNMERPSLFSKVVALGELTLTGAILPVKNISAFIKTAASKGVSLFIIPKDSVCDIPDIDNVSVWPVGHISEIISTVDKINWHEFKQKHTSVLLNKFISYKNITTETSTEEVNGLTLWSEQGKPIKYTLDSISGNETAKRALEISLAGRHHILFIGTPGSGKSLLAKSSRELLPGIDKKYANIFQLQRIDQIMNETSLITTKNISIDRHAHI